MIVTLLYRGDHIIDRGDLIIDRTLLHRGYRLLLAKLQCIEKVGFEVVELSSCS